MGPVVKILLDHAAAVFFPGQTITGKVAVNSNRQRKCTGISIKLKGSAHVEFTANIDSSKRASDRRDSATGTYTAHEEYYESKLLVWSDSQQQLMAGNFQFPFTFVLPSTSPPSFKCRYGYVSHSCEAVMSLGSGSRDVSAKLQFSVSALLDLNTNPANKSAQQLKKDKTLGWLCCRSGPVSAVVRLDRTGYVPGEAIVVSAEINNSSDRKVSKTKAELYMTVLLQAQGKKKTETLLMTSLQQPEIPKGEDCVWPGHQLIIPPLPASGLPGCSIIDVKYNLKFTVDPKYSSSPLVLNFPVTIGTVPLRETFDTFSRDPQPSPPTAGDAMATPQDQPTKRDAPAPPEAPPAYAPFTCPAMDQYPNMPPPSYIQSVSAGLNAETIPTAPEMEDFTPSYVSYTLSKKTQGMRDDERC